MMGLLVVDPGLSTTVQDAGRPGFRECGVPPAGAFDRRSASLANALTGNLSEAAVLEFTLRGGTYQATTPLALAIAGAPMSARIIRGDRSVVALRVPQSFSMQADERLELGHMKEGARTYLAVRGGWQVAHILGSASAEQPLHAGDHLNATPAQIPARRPANSLWRVPTNQPIRIINGPDSPSLLDQSPDFWRERAFRVSAQSNRMGLRLEGDSISATIAAERLSIPVCPGAIQLAGGQLIILGIACGTMGGYPLIAHVISPDLDRLAQLLPQDQIGFERVTIDEARANDHESRQRLARDLAGIQLAARDNFDANRKM